MANGDVLTRGGADGSSDPCCGYKRASPAEVAEGGLPHLDFSH